MGLQLNNIYKSYSFGKNKQDVLVDLSIKFPKKGLVAIIGKSGCGKSTLLNIIAGIEKSDAGEVLIDGHRLTNQEINDYQKRYISYVYQFYNLIDALTIKQNLLIIATIKGLNPKMLESRMIDLANQLQINHLLDRYPTELSGGQKQRVGLLRAFLCNTPILLADEPTGALNYHCSIQVMNLLKEYARHHLVIIISHNETLVRRYTSLIIDLNKNQNRYDFNISKYHKYQPPYLFKQSTRLFFYLKQQIKYQKGKLMMMFISQVFIILAFVLLVSACHGGWLYLESRFESDPLKNMIEVYPNDYISDGFSDYDLKKFEQDPNIQTVNQKLDFTLGLFDLSQQLKTYQISKTTTLKYQSGNYPQSNNQVLINSQAAEKCNLKIKDQINFEIDKTTYSFTVAGIVNDYINEGYNLYVDDQLLTKELKENLQTNGCLIIHSDRIEKVIDVYENKYLLLSYHVELLDSYQMLFDLAKIVVAFFIMISFLISIILISIILKTIFIERKRDTSLLLVNGMKKSQVVSLFCLEATMMGFLIGFFGSVFSFVIIMIINLIDLSNRLFKIPDLFKVPVLFVSSFDLYLVLILIYMLVCYLSGMQVAMMIGKMDNSILLKETC